MFRFVLKPLIALNEATKLKATSFVFEVVYMHFRKPEVLTFNSDYRRHFRGMPLVEFQITSFFYSSFMKTPEEMNHFI